MALSSLARDFRKIDIEQYADDYYVDDEPVQGLSGPDAGEVQNAINAGQAQVGKKIKNLTFSKIFNTNF